MGNIPVHPDEANKAAFYKKHGVNLKAELEDWLSHKLIREADAISADAHLGLEDEAPNTTLGRAKLARVAAVDKAEALSDQALLARTA